MLSGKKTVLVTGGNAGLGLEIVRQILASDASFHVLLGSRSIDRGNEAVKLLQSQTLKGSVEVLILDVSKEDSIAKAAETVQERYGRLDALVNNAGIMRSEGSFADQMQEFFTINALGPALMGQYFAPLLKKASGTARIVHVTSGAGSLGWRLGDPSLEGYNMKVVPYRVSKAAQNMVFACEAYELTDTNVKVFLYGPGPTQSRTNTHKGFKTAAEGVLPIVEIVQGRKDEDVNKFLHHGASNGVAPW